MHSKLINEILFCRSEDEVKQLIDNALANLKPELANGGMLCFIEECLQDLASFSPMDEDALQWSNIKMARICFFRHKQHSLHVQA